ncbi:NAD(P)/FAD-dependent oxidoreductase [Calycomorphotria hydatis]|uniref:Protoporphyrinogen oxidase n=1 Tax=Calycomorphotria hydatis TaxID=2528027 RepID=A0A517T7L5_9PLAN|nr:FAD-dependent oxidoreductase [Calycomorphotria hydatis]QDT64363.1 protoporphyrinogen oxidase [Calycomorphotria hydatis]
MPPRIAILGAGLCGLTAAREISRAGVSVSVFDKGRGVSGRMSTRRADENLKFDHGAQYFTVRDPRFEQFIAELREKGVVSHWDASIVAIEEDGIHEVEAIPRYVGVPGMNAICKELAIGQDVNCSVRVTGLSHSKQQWTLLTEGDEQLAGFDAVLCTFPAPQTSVLLNVHMEEGTHNLLKEQRLQPCWAALFAWKSSLELPFAGAFVNRGNPLSWIANNSAKPSRIPLPETWVAHGSPEWSEQNLELEAKDALPLLIEAFQSAVGKELPKPDFAVAHRWRYAFCPAPLDSGCLVDASQRLLAAGDWCHGGRVEGTFLSGLSAAEEVLKLL